MNKDILEFSGASKEEQETASRAAEAIHDSIYFSYNLPLQISIYKKCDENGKDTDEVSGCITNYMPRKNACCELTFSELFGTDMPKKEELKDFCDTTISILKNLITHWEAFRDGKVDYVCYPNADVEKSITDEFNEHLNPLKS